MKGRKWTDEEVCFLKENWKRKTIEEIADELGRTCISVRQKASRLKLGPVQKGGKKRRWTKEELDYLMDKWGYVSMATIAKNLNRSVSAVQLKASREGLGPFTEAGDYITLNQLFVVLRGTNIGSTYTKQQWIDKGLPVKMRKVKNSSVQIVYLSDWWEWAEKNRTIIDFSKMEPLSLGKEPKWLQEQRKADKKRSIYFKTTPWTPAEDKLLKDLLKTYKYTYKELSLRLRRTEGAIKRRMLDLKIKARPLRMPNHNPWSKQETELLIDLYHKGHCPNTMAIYINRSAQACSGKIERLIKEGVIKPRAEYRKSC